MCRLGSMALSSCKYTYIYIYIYTYVYIHMYTYIQGQMCRLGSMVRSSCKYPYIYICIYIYVYTYICKYTYMDVQWGGAVHVFCEHGTSRMRWGHTAHCHALPRTATHCNTLQQMRWGKPVTRKFM